MKGDNFKPGERVIIGGKEEIIIGHHPYNDDVLLIKGFGGMNEWQNTKNITKKR